MKRGEIWLVTLGPTIGAEIKKTRPCVIVNDNAVGVLPLKVIVPLTEWNDRYSIASWLVRLTPDSTNKLDKTSTADTFQVRSVSQQRFVRQLGKLSDESIQDISNALALVLSLQSQSTEIKS